MGKPKQGHRENICAAQIHNMKVESTQDSYDPYRIYWEYFEIQVHGMQKPLESNAN